MINDQEYITTELKKTLEKMIILSTPRLNNLIKKLQRFLSNKATNPEKLYEFLRIDYYKNINLNQNQFT